MSRMNTNETTSPAQDTENVFPALAP